MAAALRKRLDGAIDEDDWNSRGGEGIGDAPVDGNTVRRALERREEDAVDAPRDQLLTAGPGVRAGARAGSACTGPHDCV